MSPAQEEALRRAAAATGPIRIPSSTARILSDRFGYVEPADDGWRITPQGRMRLAEERARARHRETEQRLSSEDRRWAERVYAWLQAHRRFKRRAIAEWLYARHVAACDHAGIDPVPESARWTPEARAWVEQAVRVAADCLTQFDEQVAIAKARGGGVTVDYEADPKMPSSRREAARAATEGAAVVNLRTYRERRPTRGGAA